MASEGTERARARARFLRKQGEKQAQQSRLPTWFGLGGQITVDTARSLAWRLQDRVLIQTALGEIDARPGDVLVTTISDHVNKTFVVRAKDWPEGGEEYDEYFKHTDDALRKALGIEE